MKTNTDWRLILSLTFTTLVAATAAFAQTNGLPGGTNGPIITIRAPDVSASEAGDIGRFNVSRGDSSNGNLVVWLQVTGTAMNGIDYQVISNRVLIPEGAHSAEITVTAIDDAMPEPNESVLLRVIAPPVMMLDSIYRIGSPSSASVVITDNDGFVESNRPPTVRIVQPTSNTVFTAPTLIFIRAEARDSDGVVASVEFFANDQRLGFSPSVNASNLFTLVWSNAPAGEYNLTASATDNGGASSLSPPVHITVRTNPPPPTCLRPPEGLVGWWTLDNNVIDLVTGHLATLQNGPVFVPGQITDALRFDGIDDAVRIAASPGLDVGAADGMTIELWVNPDDISQTEPLVEWNNGVDLFGAHLWIMANQPGAGLQPPSSAVAGPGQIYAAFTLTGQWYQMVTDAGTLLSHAFQHVALTYSKSTGLGRIYRNGALVTEQNLGTFRPQTEFDVYLGRRPAGPKGDPIVGYHGVLDEVSIYNRALSATEIAAIYAANTAGKCRPTLPPPTNQPPIVRMILPIDGSRFAAPATLGFAADAQDFDGSIVSVEFFANDHSIGQGVRSTSGASWQTNQWYFSWSNTPPAEYSFSAKATDNRGTMTFSAPVHVTVFSTNPPPTTPIFDLSHDYSLAANPNGPWSYGYLAALDGTFGLLHAARTFAADNGVPIGVWELNTYQLPIVAKVLGPGEAHSDGDHFTAPAGTVYFAPGADGAPQNFGVIRFTVPPGGGGAYRLETSVRSLFDNTRSRDADFHVVQNGHELFGQFLPPNSGTSYANLLTLAPGDTLDFAIGRGADGLTADTGLKIQATLALVTNLPPSETNCVAPPSGLVAWWPFEGNANDLNGTASFALSGDPAYQPGKVGTALHFDGRNDEGHTPASAALNVGTGDGFSIETWINPEAVTLQPILEYSVGPAVTGVHFWLGVYGSGSLFANLIDTGGSSHSWRSDTDIVVANVRQHVGMSYEKATGLLRFYLNGIKVTEHFLGVFTPQTSYPLLVGYRPDDAHFAGWIDELSLYGRVLTEGEFASIHAADAAGKCCPTLPPPTNQPPVVRMILPIDGSRFAAPATLGFAADAQDFDGSIVSVEFFANDHSIGQGVRSTSGASWQTNQWYFSWSNTPPAEYSFSAKATDNRGTMTFSAPVHVTVFSTNPPPTTPIFDLSHDYSLAANPNGPWSYGYLTALDGTFGLLHAARTFAADNGVPIGVWELNTYQLPIVAKVLGPGEAHSDGDHFTAPAGTVYFAPGADGAPQDFGVIRFTVPPGGGGAYRLETSVRSLFDNTRSRDSDFHVVQNGHELFGQFLPPNSGTSYANLLTLAPGDTLDFAIGRGADGLTADTGLKIQATLVLVTNLPPSETNQLPAISIAATDPTAAEGVSMWCSNTVFGVNSNWFDPVWQTNCHNPTGTNIALFTVRRNGAINDPLRVYYSIGGTASNGLDYAALSGVVTIPAGRRAAEIRVLPLDDDIPERIETVVLRLRLPPLPLTAGDSPYTLTRPKSAAAYITDNDRPPPPCARLDDGTVHLCAPFTNQCFRLEISTDLAHWETVCTNAVADGAAHHLDPDAADSLRQFIRFIPVPCPSDGE